ncbi:MAG: methyltransferase domain-containing protein [Spirochaetaceae bacterium]|nr:methyltransferase domain-containing protein [Spirochaetaceae bacterium]
MSNKWIWFDWLVAAFRYAKVNKYVKQNSIIADVGCGREGAFLKSHAGKITHGYGFDFRINEHEEDNLSFINNKELEGSLPLADCSVDDVFLNAVLEHLEDPAGVISESVRILKSDGRIIMTTPTRIAKPVLEFLSFRLHLINEDEIREHKHYFNKADIKNLIEAVNKHLQGNEQLILEKYSIFEFGFNSLIVLRKK